MKWGAAVFAAVVLAGTGLFFWIVTDDEIKFASVADEEELVDALIENFSTGQESVILWTRGFKIDRKQIASYVSSEISNDAEDMCIMPVSYMVGLFDFAGLWQFRLYYAEDGHSDTPGDNGENLGEKTALSYTTEDVETAQMQVSAALDQIVPQIRETAGDDEISMHKAIFEYLCENVSYDYELSDAIISGDTGNPLRKNRGCYGALIQKETVCSGYAGAYKAICDRLGLDCWVAESADHAWNLVRLKDGRIFCVDATSGDQDTWIADQFFLISPQEYEAEYGYRVSDNCYIPPRFQS